MKKTTYNAVTLNCIMQSSEISSDTCPNGVLSLNPEDQSFRFEEAVHKKRDKRNPFIYQGDHCTLTHLQNGKYQIHMKTINASAIKDRNELAYSVYSDILNALNVMD